MFAFGWCWMRVDIPFFLLVWFSRFILVFQQKKSSRRKETKKEKSQVLFPTLCRVKYSVVVMEVCVHAATFIPITGHASNVYSTIFLSTSFNSLTRTDGARCGPIHSIRRLVTVLHTKQCQWNGPMVETNKNERKIRLSVKLFRCRSPFTVIISLTLTVHFFVFTVQCTHDFDVLGRFFFSFFLRLRNFCLLSFKIMKRCWKNSNKTRWG